MMYMLRWWVWRWKHRVWYHRFTHGVCTLCGAGKPMGGDTRCRACFERLHPYLTQTR
jgi:ribosomal protein L40E